MASHSPSPQPKTFLQDSKTISAVELAIISIVVIGHNVFQVLPNEVPILAVLGLVSIRLRNGSFSAMGFKRPASWTRLILLAVAAAAVRILVSALAIEPLTSHFWPPAVAPSGMEAIRGNSLVALKWLGLVWSFAAFGEEISYRGYAINRAADLGNGSTLAYWIGMVFSSVLFGYGHYYKGPAGIIDSGFTGLVLGTAYLISGRNLWTCIIAHGLIDTFGVVLLYFGLDS